MFAFVYILNTKIEEERGEGADSDPTFVAKIVDACKVI